MSIASLIAALALILAFFPQPLLWLDSAFVGLLARSMVRATDGGVGMDQATDRIRMAEGIDPTNSARLLSAIGFVAASAFGIWRGPEPMPVTILVAVLAPTAAVMIVFLERNWWTRVGALLFGAVCVAAIL